MSEKKKSKYPECDKLSSVRSDMSRIEEFLEWAGSQGIMLASAEGERWGAPDYAPITETNDKLLMRYFEIDPAKLEKERREILEEQQRANEETG